MRSMAGGRAAVLILALSATVAVGGLPASAAPSGGDGDGDGGQDVAVPAADAAAQLADVGVTLEPAGETTLAEADAATLASTAVEDFRYDPLVRKGYAGDVCYGRLRPGTARAYNELQRIFGGSPGTLYTCRERWNAAEEPDCNGTLVSPSSNPNFYSTCWSNHAQGRAFDLMVGRAGVGYNVARGNAVVNWLLAPDRSGNYSVRARRLGVQQILWNDRCWNTDDDRGVASADKMRRCGIGHFDHVHIDLTIAGAMGRTTYWGGQPVIARKASGLFWWDDETGDWSVQSWFNYRPVVRNTGAWRNHWDVALPGNWDADADDDDIFLWDRGTGDWAIVSWNGYRNVTRRTGAWSTRWDQIIPGDWDGYGRNNDLFLWDTDTGNWHVLKGTTDGMKHRSTGRWSTSFDRIVVGDFDEDNRFDEMLVRDQDTGTFAVISWLRFVPTQRSTHTWAPAYNQLVVGDWDSDGELNDVFVRQSRTGRWWLFSWAKFQPRSRTSGSWPGRRAQIVAGDRDGEGRIDDMLVRRRGTGDWSVIVWQYYKPATVRTGKSSSRWDQIISGPWG